jgi:hypothetical protein
VRSGNATAKNGKRKAKKSKNAGLRLSRVVEIKRKKDVIGGKEGRGIPYNNSL